MLIKTGKIMFEEKTVSKEVLYRGKVIDVEMQEVTLSNGNRSFREILRHSGGACMLALDKNNYVYLVRQYRKAVEKETLEIAAGKLEEGEKPLECALRELKEETGLIAHRVDDLGFIYTSPGFCDETLYLFLGRDLEQSDQSPDPDELVACEKHSIEDCFKMIEEGLICDSKTIVAICKTAAKLGINPGL